VDRARSALAAANYERSLDVLDATATGARATRLLLKRCVDVSLSAAALLVTSPLLLLISIWIRFDSAGPVIFRQTRIGKGGRRFEIWKFRTMHCDVSDQRHRDLVVPLVRAALAGRDESQSYQASLTPDPRITRAGRFLRRTCLDELPQLVNVFKGDMSLVGPRPPVLYEYEEIGDQLRDRFLMRPGMTGLWQVAGHSRLNFRRMYELDIEYVRHWSLRLDWKILLKTLPAVLLGERSSRDIRGSRRSG